MNQSKLRKFAEIISIVFNPIMNSSIAFILLIVPIPHMKISHKLTFISIALVFSSVIPFLYVYYLKLSGKVKSIDLDERLKRINPLLFSIISYIVGFLLLMFLQAPKLVQGLMFCYASNTSIIIFITRWWKVSIHSTGICGPLVALSYNYGTIVIPFYFLVFLVGSSRIILNKHTVMQVIAGVSIGLGLTAFQIHYFFA